MTMKFKVTFQLMIEPSEGDATFSKSYTVEAENEYQALVKAEDLKDAVDDDKYGELRYRSVFNYSVKEI
jgi:hypothetical protein